MFLLLLLFATCEFTTSISYTCDRRSACGCSKHSTVILSKIIDGEPVTVSKSWGWMASLRRNDIHQCGASLITSYHAITAAHCVQNVKLYSDLSLNFDTKSSSKIGQLRNIAGIHIHPKYDERLFSNDLAILRLDKPFNLRDSNMAIICLPNASDHNLTIAEYPPIGENVIAIGWGTTDPNQRTYTQILQQVTLKAIDRNDSACLNTINDDVVQFCAGLHEGGKDTCQGDSGGPLMLFKNGRWQLVGITSYGAVCASPGFAGVYTRIAHYDSYIKEILEMDEKLITNNKNSKIENRRSSNTENFYRQSLIELFFIYLFIKSL